MHQKLIFLFLSYPLILYLCIFISKKLRFFDKPSSRKIHTYKVVNTGGIAIFIFYIFLVTNFEINKEIELIIVYSLFVVICGFMDDQFQITPGVKLMLIFVPSLMLIYEGFVVNSLGIYELIGVINTGKFNYIFTLLCIGLLVNAFNYLDGIDGLAILSTIIPLIYFILLSNNKTVDTILLIFIFPLIINLIFNFLNISHSFKIFLGDSGSLLLGFIISAMIIYLSKIENIHPGYLIWSVWLPVYDFLFVNIFRIRNKKKFYEPDKNHLHHFFLNKTKSHLKTSIIISTLNIMIIFSGYIITAYTYKLLSIMCFITFFIIYYKLRYFGLRST